MVPLVLIAYGRLISSGRYRFVLSDLLMPLTGLWMIAAPATVDGLPQALVKGGVMALDFMVAYAAMRAIPQKRHETFALLKILCASLAIVGYLSILDPITGGPLLHELATDIWGYRIDYAVEYSHEHYLRFGLFRASGPFEHPILLGIVMVYGLVLARAARKISHILRRWMCHRSSCVVLFGAIACVNVSSRFRDLWKSGPISISLVCDIGAYDYGFHYFPSSASGALRLDIRSFAT